MADLERLQKIIANAGIASRREAETWVADGRVSVNGRRASLGDRADPGSDEIRIDGRPLPQPQEKLYLALNKPRGYTTTRNDPHAERTVMELLEEVPASVYPVGRLDVDTEGLLLFTTDGEFANRLTHPRYKVPKVYEALVEGQVGSGAVRALQRGVELDDGMTRPAEVKVLAARPTRGREPAQTLLRLTIREGRKRQVRRMLAAVGHPVLELRRLRIGGLDLGDLPTGRWRYLEPREVWNLLQQAEEDPRMKAEESRQETEAARTGTVSVDQRMQEGRGDD
ncbi:MAG: rRNA pseudouridine synthase [Armatimonadetes bacterium]|nr:rRNA pseudouridine synthase [Armatimonadota bacterium]